jgi:hypothetical protein
MPDANGQMQLIDFRGELKSRGFDGFSDQDLNQLINRGYFYVARKTQTYWDSKDYSGAVPSDGKVSVLDTGAIVGFKTVEAVYFKSGSTYIKLDPIDDSQFRESYFPAYQRGETAEAPTVYRVDGNTLWVLPKVKSVGSATIELRYNSRPTPLTADNMVPITPVDYDEVIMLSALIRAHKRANEMQMAIVVQADLDEAFDDIRDLEQTRSREQQERVVPDNGWL